MTHLIDRSARGPGKGAFDRTPVGVADPTGQAQFLGLVDSVLAEKDALHFARDLKRSSYG